jgi:hypothetical protein
MLSTCHESLICHNLITLIFCKWIGYSNVFGPWFNLHFTGQFFLQVKVVLLYNHGTLPWHVDLDNHINWKKFDSVRKYSLWRPCLYCKVLIYSVFFAIDKRRRKVNALCTLPCRGAVLRSSTNYEREHLKWKVHHATRFFCDRYFNRMRQLSTVVVKILTRNMMEIVIITYILL